MQSLAFLWKSNADFTATNIATGNKKQNKTE